MKSLDYYMSLDYQVNIIKDDEEGGFVAYFPDLPGCITCGETQNDALTNAQDAKKAWISAAIEDGVKINEPECVVNL